MYNTYLNDDSLHHVATEMLLQLVELFQGLLEATSGSVFEDESQGAEDHSVQLDDVGIPERRQES